MSIHIALYSTVDN